MHPTHIYGLGDAGDTGVLRILPDGVVGGAFHLSDVIRLFRYRMLKNIIEYLLN